MLQLLLLPKTLATKKTTIQKPSRAAQIVRWLRPMTQMPWMSRLKSNLRRRRSIMKPYKTRYSAKNNNWKKRNRKRRD